MFGYAAANVMGLVWYLSNQYDKPFFKSKVTVYVQVTCDGFPAMYQASTMTIV